MFSIFHKLLIYCGSLLFHEEKVAHSLLLDASGVEAALCGSYVLSVEP